MTMSPLSQLRELYRLHESNPSAEAEQCLARANSNAGRNVFLAQDADATLGAAKALSDSGDASAPLWGVPVSLKDCFDLAGYPTSCGSAFYLRQNGIAARDSEVAARLRKAGAIITGKTHLHQIAYGITGEGRDFGDCVQPRNARWLTGGSSSGAAASVQEGSALAAIGTDTGGSVRVPAALCGLAGYRSSLALNTTDIWRGGYHLAASFDTVGWLYRDLRDGPVLGAALLQLELEAAPSLSAIRIGVPQPEFFHDCEAGVLATQTAWTNYLLQHGAKIDKFDSTFWSEAVDIFVPIQASEAAALHRGNYQHFETQIAERLAWGASIKDADLASLHERRCDFRTRMEDLLRRFDFLLFPCAAVAHLIAGADHSQTRARLLRYTAPASLAGLPAVVLPGESGGLQLVGRMNSDARLLAVSAALFDGPTH